MSTPRKLARVITLPPPAPGQFGPAHTVVEVIRLEQWLDADPFILLMDDRIDGKLGAGPHPHAGFETVSFLVSGRLGAEGGGGWLAPGDVEWTTCGKGIVHGPEHPVEGQFRLLQLWVTLPKKDRWTEPDHQLIPVADALLRREPGAEVRLYSGATGALRSPTRNRVPITLIDVQLEPSAAIEQALPLSHNGFFYVLSGRAAIGPAEAGTELQVGQIGWLDRSKDDGTSDGMGTVRIANAGADRLRVLLYAGQRQDIPLVSYGPFIGDTREDIHRSIERYRAGTFRRY